MYLFSNLCSLHYHTIINMNIARIYLHLHISVTVLNLIAILSWPVWLIRYNLQQLIRILFCRKISDKNKYFKWSYMSTKRAYETVSASELKKYPVLVRVKWWCQTDNDGKPKTLSPRLSDAPAYVHHHQSYPSLVFFG